MNERIRLLWRQAVLNNTKTPMNFQDAADEFAELIVNECCQVLLEEVEVALSASGDAVWPEGLIKEHFGVK